MDSAQLQSVQVVEVVVAKLLVREELLLLARLLLRSLDARLTRETGTAPKLLN